MRLRRAVPKIPAKSLVAPGSPLNNLIPHPNHSESTLPQPLIPRHFISFSSDVYRKSGEGSPRPSPKVCQLVTNRSPSLRARTNTRNPTPLTHLLHNSRTPLGWGYLCGGTAKLFAVARVSRDESWLSLLCLHGARNAGHNPTGSQVPLRRNPQSARITQVAQDTAARKHIRPGWCLRYRERTWGRQCQNAVPVASRSRNAGQGSHSQEGLGPTF